MPRPMSRYKTGILKPPRHSFTEKGVYLEYGHVKTYANKTQADNKVRELKSIGYNVFRSYDWPFIIMEERRNPMSSIPSQKEYEENELRMFFSQLKEIEKAPLQERQEGYQELVEAIRSRNGVQYLIDDVYGFLLNGSFGFGAYHWFWNIQAKPRTKVITGFKVALMLNFLTDDRHVVKALKENIPDLEGLNKVLIEEMNEYKKEINE